MDTGLLNLGEEHFAFKVFNEYDESTCDTNRPYFSEWDDDDERELNGDIGLIPMASSFGGPIEDITSLTDAPPEIFDKIGDWSTLINIDVVDVEGIEQVNQPIHQFNGKESDFDLSIGTDCLDLSKYLLADDTVKRGVIKAPVKKIDLNAQKYIVEDEDEASEDAINESIESSDDLIDVETVVDVSLPVLEANDALALLEQFEASETPNAQKIPKCKDFSASFDFDELDVISPLTPVNIFDDEKLEPVKKVIVEKPPTETCNEKKFNNKQILNALPKELIARINESGKRKPITVIPPIPNTKKRNVLKSLECVKPQKVAKQVDPLPRVQQRVVQIQGEHDYCSIEVAPTKPKESPKDSGFQSSEDDDRLVIANQPMVKNADGKLMVSLLKLNTIRTSVAAQAVQKRKLNLEEYKRKRPLAGGASQSASSGSSTCGSPRPEDEHVRRQQHAQKLQRMALELLQAAPRSAAPPPPAPASVYPRIPESCVDFPYVIAPPPGVPVRKVVNIALNTDVSDVRDKELFDSLQQIGEMGPLLRKASDKINSQSFINALIENLPKVRAGKAVAKAVVEEQAGERREHYLPVHCAKVETQSVAVQTDFDDIIEDIQARYRRRLEGSAASTSGSSVRTRSPEKSPVYSISSGSSSSYSRGRAGSRRCYRSDSFSSSSSSSSNRSRSRSRSASPKRFKFNTDKLKEIEERRVVYIGGVLPKTSREDLRLRFCRFGEITSINLYFRDFGDNYGFVTFANKFDAFRALEHGNDGNVYPKYDLSFGGRRIFCKTTYSDLDNVRDDDDIGYFGPPRQKTENTFDDLLRVCQERLKRKP